MRNLAKRDLHVCQRCGKLIWLVRLFGRLYWRDTETTSCSGENHLPQR